MYRKLAYVLLTSTMLLLSACNTMSGAGKDIQKGGEAIEDSAEKNKGY
ncbi:MAG TPA: entericidin A/B family lipoprotein [Methylophilaceae bacterium]|nr:entericidin A/B family lipoprotein [Methylophilaceae bacterium]